MKQEKAIVFIVDRKYRFALASTIINLQKTNKNNYDAIVVYYDGFTANDIALFSNLEPKIRFIEYNYQMWEKDHTPVKSDLAKSFLARYSHLAWSKYKIIELLQDYQKILFLDLDILIKDDISDIFNIDGVAWRNGDSFHKKFNIKNRNVDFPELTNIPNDFPSPNGGLLYLTDCIDCQSNLQDAKDFLIRFIDHFKAGLDELVLAWIVYKNKLPLTRLNPQHYNAFPQMYRHDTKVIHFMGKEKPWNSEIMQTIFPEWLANYKESQEIIGTFPNDFVVEHSFPGKFITKKLNEQRWFKFLTDIEINFPSNLKLIYKLENEWLILKYQQDLYYEFKFNQYADGFLTGLWIRDKEILTNLELKEKVRNLTAKNKNYHLLEDHRGMYLYTDKDNIQKISGIFEEFYKNTINLIGIK